MSGIELITLTFSFILGLGVAQILSAASLVLRRHDDRPLHWVPLTFAFCIFLLHIQVWFAIFELDTVIAGWDWALYAPLLALLVLLYMSGAVVLPPVGAEPGESLAQDFEKRGKISLLLLMIYILGWIPLNAFISRTWLDPSLFLNLVLIIALAFAYWTHSSRVRGAATVAFVALLFYGFAFVYSAPDVLG